MPDADAAQITALVKDGGRITGYQLSDGRVLTRRRASSSRRRAASGCRVATREGTEYLKSLPDEREENNLGNLPSIQK
jgi:hypothetical protein